MKINDYIKTQKWYFCDHCNSVYYVDENDKSTLCSCGHMGDEIDYETACKLMNAPKWFYCDKCNVVYGVYDSDTFTCDCGNTYCKEIRNEEALNLVLGCDKM